jgi:hypothetical protein
MSELWLEALGSLKEGESVEGSFPCQLDYMKGYVVLTNQRMVFIQGGGRFNKVFTKSFKADYSEIKDIKIDPAETLHIKIVGESYAHYLQVLDVPVSEITDVLDKYVNVHYFYEESLVQQVPT